jgi:hypothetical protein
MINPTTNRRRVRLEVLAAHPRTTVPTRARIERALTRAEVRQAA